jgi:glycosyltransferase involved in cell wall biosynthesis
MARVDILIPTYNRPEALAVTLTSLCFQQHQAFNVVIANQGNRAMLDGDASLQSVMRLLKLHGNAVSLLDNLPRQGMAQQRQFLLDHAHAPYCLFLDDDVTTEPFMMRLLLKTIMNKGCGLAGCAAIGLSYRHDHRPQEEQIEFWNGQVLPETVTPASPAWQRYKLHNAANILHIQERLGVTADRPRIYKIAWVGGCILFNTQKLRDVDGFLFWRELPPEHCGEDVLAQLRVMKRFGGCGVLPSGAYHQELPTTISERKVDAPKCLPI